MFWSYLALAVTLQLLSRLSLAGRLKRMRRSEEGGRRDEGQQEVRLRRSTFKEFGFKLTQNSKVNSKNLTG